MTIRGTTTKTMTKIMIGMVKLIIMRMMMMMIIIKMVMVIVIISDKD